VVKRSGDTGSYNVFVRDEIETLQDHHHPSSTKKKYCLDGSPSDHVIIVGTNGVKVADETVEPRVVHEWGNLVLSRVGIWVRSREVVGASCAAQGRKRDGALLALGHSIGSGILLLAFP
jgi:hypothetical protein